MREEGGRIVLMDLGSGTEIREEPDPDDGVLSGTPLYMAPELLAGGAADVRSDIYSLGVLLYYAVTGTYPVRGESLRELHRNHALERRHHLRDARPDLPAAFVEVIERALDPRRENRYASAGEMERALSAAMGLGESGEIRRPRARGGSPASPRRFLGFLAVGVAAIITAIVLFLWPGLMTGSSYTVDAALYRASDGGTEQLLPGARVATGDRLHLQFEASRAVHLYVLAEDDRGEAFLLFPLPGRSLSNPLPAKRMHRIPPDENGGRMSWGISSAGGTERVLIVASPKALVDFEEKLLTLPAPQRADAAMALPLDAEALAGLRGIGHLLEDGSAGDPAETRVAFDMARRLGGGAESTEGVWVRQIDLINPGP
jgi:serine/threonine protein kinase